MLLTSAEVHLARLRAAVGIETKIFIFGLINIVILLIILLIYLVFRNIAKLLMERRQNVIGCKTQDETRACFCRPLPRPYLASLFRVGRLHNQQHPKLVQYPGGNLIGRINGGRTNVLQDFRIECALLWPAAKRFHKGAKAP